jgi:hypothetical protein
MPAYNPTYASIVGLGALGASAYGAFNQYGGSPGGPWAGTGFSPSEAQGAWANEVMGLK